MTEQNKNYNLEYKNIVKEIDNKGIKPKLFLHACCGPCLTYPLTELVNHFDVTVGYINQNIYPKEEYDRREETLRRFVKEFNEENNLNVEVISLPYDYDSFFPLIEKYGPIKGIRIAKAHNMYRQDYCGCSYSLEARKNYLKEKKL